MASTSHGGIPSDTRLHGGSPSLSAHPYFTCLIWNFLCDLTSSPSYHVLLLPSLQFLWLFLVASLVRARFLSDKRASGFFLSLWHCINSSPPPSYVTSPWCSQSHVHLLMGLAAQLSTCNCYAKYFKCRILCSPLPLIKVCGEYALLFWGTSTHTPL